MRYTALSIYTYYSFVIDGDPVGRLEPAVVLDVGDAILEVAESFGQISLE